MTQTWTDVLTDEQRRALEGLDKQLAIWDDKISRAKQKLYNLVDCGYGPGRAVRSDSDAAKRIQSTIDHLEKDRENTATHRRRIEDRARARAARREVAA